MRFRSLFAVTVVSAALTAPLSAQRPNFSGVWLRVDSAPQGRGVAATGDAAFRTGDMGSGWGTPLTLAQTADRLSVVFDFFIAYDLQPKARYAYAMDGKESVNTVVVGHANVAVKSWATWKGDTLEITSKFPVPPGVPPQPNTPDVMQRLYSDASGRLVIEAQRHGANARVNTVTTTYTKRP